MFANRHIEVKFVKTPKTPTDEAKPSFTKEDVVSIAKELTTDIAVTVVVVSASVIGMRVLGDLVIIAARERIRRL